MATILPPKAYKILTKPQWAAWSSAPETPFRGAGIDLDEGFIHLSTAEQAGPTYELFFAGQDVVLVEVDLSKVIDEIKWEEGGRDGVKFPHVYGEIPMTAVARVWETGVHTELLEKLKSGTL